MIRNNDNPSGPLPASPTGRRVVFHAKELTRYRRHHVGFAFQFYNLIPSLTALENVAVVTEIAENSMKLEDGLALVGRSERLNHFPA